MSSPPPAAPVPPPPFVPPPNIGTVVVTSNALVTSCIVSAIVGAAFLVTWAVVRKPLRKVYLKRTVRLVLNVSTGIHATSLSSP